MTDATWQRQAATPPPPPKPFVAGSRRYLPNGRLVHLEWNGEQWSCWMIPTAAIPDVPADQIADAEQRALPALIAEMERETQLLRETMTQEDSQ